MPDSPPPSVAPGASAPAGSTIAFEGFSGTYRPMLDEKSRVIVPAKFRDALAAGLAITYGQEQCLYLYTASRYWATVERAAMASDLSESARTYQRMVMANAHVDSLDRQGRVVIPLDLRRYARLTRELAVLGVGTRIEVWDARRWEDYRAAQEPLFATLSRDEPFPGAS